MLEQTKKTTCFVEFSLNQRKNSVTSACLQSQRVLNVMKGSQVVVNEFMSFLLPCERCLHVTAKLMPRRVPSLVCFTKSVHDVQW